MQTNPVRAATSSSTRDSGEALANLRLVTSSTQATPSTVSLAKIAAGAAAFMKSSGLSTPGEEVTTPTLRTRWAADHVVRFGSVDLVVMNLNLQSTDGTKWTSEPGDAFEVIAVKKTAAGYTFSKFENAVALPQSIKLGIGQVWTSPPKKVVDPQDDYYVELKGPAMVEALKAVFTKTYYHGFSANLVEGGGGKAPFDPTPGRIWRAVNPSFSLRQGSTPEIADVYATQLDGDFNAYYQGSAGRVMPWGASIRKVLVDGKWRATIPPKGLGQGGAVGPSI